jgi:MSHA biogenesis protein MshM
MNHDELEYYLSHRLGVAGYRGPRLFSHEAIKRLYKVSHGIPRLANILAHKAMMVAFGEGVRRIEDDHIRLAIADTESTHSTTLRGRIFRYLAALAATLLLSVGVFLAGGWV